MRLQALGRVGFVSLTLCCADAASVLTGQYDNSRSGANTSETVLTQSNVGTDVFGQRGAWAIDGFAYAQPLVVDNACGVSSALVTATMNDTIFCFDANASGTPAIWSRHVGSPRTTYYEGAGTFNYSEPIGCMATPVVNVSLAVVYETCVDESGVWWLYSLNLADGSDYHTAVAIAGSANGNTFDPTVHLQRGALLLSSGNVYITFGSYGDHLPYQGWIFAYNATSLNQIAAFCAANTANGAGGIWMSGGGVAANAAGHVFLATGNGAWDGTANFGESFLEFDANLNLASYLTPANWSDLYKLDLDIGTSRTILVGSSIIGSGKDERIWVAQQGALGGLQGRDKGPVQVMAGSGGGEWGGLVFANNTLYTSTGNDAIFSYPWNGSTLAASTVQSYPQTFGWPGATCAYSSNGSIAETELLWCVTVPTSGGSANIVTKQAVLKVFNAATLLEISEWPVGTYAKFCEPTVANGKVYVSTFDNSIEVFASIPAKKPMLSWPTPAAITFGGALGSAQLNASSSVAGAFVYSPPAGTVLPVGNGQVLSAVFTPSDTSDYQTASVATTINVNPASPTVSAVQIIETKTLSRDASNNIVIQLNLANNGQIAAGNVVLTGLKIGGVSGTPLPQIIGGIAAGAVAQVTVTVPGSTGAPGAPSSLALSATYTGGSFSSSARIILP